MKMEWHMDDLTNLTAVIGQLFTVTHLSFAPKLEFAIFNVSTCQIM